MNEETLRHAIVRAGKRLSAAGLIVATDGNISCRLGASSFLVTPTGLPKGSLTPASIVRLHFDEKNARASSEYRLHELTYRSRPDVGAVVHAHPPALLSFALARKPIDARWAPEIEMTVGDIPLVPPAPPGSLALARAVARALRRAQVCLLANHGAVSVGQDLTEALNRLERAELVAKALLGAILLGGPRRFAGGRRR